MASELISKLVTQHQSFAEQWLPQLEQLAGNASDEVVALVKTFKEEILQHIHKEEQILFPLIAEGKAKWAGSTVSSLQTEHRDHTQCFDEIFKLVSNADGQQQLRDCLVQFNNVLQAHTELEEQILFPRALSGERIG